jgi:hypothetical protein
VNHGLSLYLTVTVLVTGEPRSVIIFIEKLEIVDWRILLCQFDDVDNMCNQFIKTFLELARECIPTKTVTVRYNDRPSMCIGHGEDLTTTLHVN